jgi:hypothetical protein
MSQAQIEKNNPGAPPVPVAGMSCCFRRIAASARFNF